jgi:hypothetical protein
MSRVEEDLIEAFEEMGAILRGETKAEESYEINFSKVIGLKGKIGAGKSTAAEYFVERGYKLIKFADPIKDMLRELGLTNYELEGPLKDIPCNFLCGVTPRHAMQMLGTDWGRDLIHTDVWVNLWCLEAAKHPLVVVDDCRFLNEARAIRARGGVVIEIRRPAFPGASSAHISEVQDWQADMRVLNEGFRKDILFARIEGALEIWLEERGHDKREGSHIPKQIRA